MCHGVRSGLAEIEVIARGEAGPSSRGALSYRQMVGQEAPGAMK
jgi:hypothetical protein